MPNATREDRLELVLHLQQSRSTHSPDAAAARARAQVLIQDILGSRLGVETEAGGENYLRAHGFTDLGKALAASRALQLAFEGFRSAGSAGRPNISLVLDSLPASEAPTSYTGPSVEQKDLLHVARPSQVLITQVLYDRVDPCQPLALRSFPPRPGVYELLWTSAERLDELRAEAESVPVPVEPTYTTTLEDAIRPAVEAPPPPSRDPLPPPVAAPVYAPLDREVVALETAPGRSHWRMFAIGATAAILIGVGLVIGPAYFGNRQPKTPATEPPATISQDTDPSAGPIEQPPSTVPHPTQPDSLKGSGLGAKPAIIPPPVGHPPTQKPDTGNCPFSIPNALQYAGKYRDQHRYDEAEQEYRRVLDCDRNNQEAKDGLARTKFEKSEN